ncbi:phage tail tip lysozyme [Nocardia jejuensis]|uniref:phage tail tip lysozyme n=1 Tax=Nocardia jejuensis TaxID=328049 RepID=UPI00082F19E5|nr:phage tail tip lysozyme [Nocardia jejuensis]
MSSRYKVDPPLPHPDGASTALSGFIDWGTTAIEAYLHIVGPGGTVPDFLTQLAGDRQVLTIDHASSAVTVTDYKDLAQQLDSAKTQIQVSDRDVGTSTASVSVLLGEVSSDIDHYVTELRVTLQNTPPAIRPKPSIDDPYPSKYLPAGVETSLMSAIAGAVGKTHDRVLKAIAEMKTRAGGISDQVSAPVGSDASLPAGSGGGVVMPSMSRGGSDRLYGGSGSQKLGKAGFPRNQPIDDEQPVDPQEIYSYLRGKYKLTHNEAVAILGNMQVESGLKPGNENKQEGAIGLIQWEGGRDDNLQAFAGARVRDWRAQVDFMMYELNGSESAAFAGFRERAALSPAEGAAYFDEFYERSKGTTRQERIGYAMAFAKSLADTPTRGPSTRGPSAMV